MISTKNILLFSFAITCLVTIQAQEGVLDDTLKLDEIIVTGSKLAVSRDNVPLTVSVIRKEEIEESSESALLPILSEQVPGVFITERGITGFGVANGSAGQISIRGIGGSPNTQVLVLLNGNPQYMGIMGHPLADAYVASDVERVEVIRGPASTLYGSNAMGGVINIITKEDKEEGFSGNVRGMYGSYNTVKLMANGGYRIEDGNVVAGVNYDRTDGHRDSSDFSIFSSYLQGGYKFNSHFEFKSNFSISAFEAQDPGPVEGNPGYRIDILRGMGAAELNNQFDKISGSLRFFYNFGEHTITDGFHSLDNNYGLVAYESFQLLPGNSITLGLDYKQYGGMAENTLVMNGVGVQFIDTALYELAGYIQIQQEFYQKFVFNTGFRMDYNSVAGLEPVPTAGLTYKPNTITSFKLSASKGFRNPTLRELFMWAPANNDLKSERMMNYELGVLNRLLKDQLSLELTLFLAEGDNLIKMIVAEGVRQYQNTGDFLNKGIELAASYCPVKNLHLNTNYSFIHMETPVLATPEQQLYVSGSYKWNKLRFHLSWQSVTNLYTQTAPSDIKVSYNLLNSKIGFKLNDSFDAFLKVENILSEHYEINYGYPMPGRIGFIGLNIHF